MLGKTLRKISKKLTTGHGWMALGSCWSPRASGGLWEPGCLGTWLKQVGSGWRKRENLLLYLFVCSTYLTSEPVHPNGF